MKDYILGSHNTMSYLRPKTWWGRLFRFVARCQSKTLAEQWEAGVRYFDLRVGYDSSWNAEFRHGAMAYSFTKSNRSNGRTKSDSAECGGFDDVEDVLQWLDEMAQSSGERVWVRLLLEKCGVRSAEWGAKNSEEMFKLDCERWERKYPNLLFHCGRRKSDWKQLYDFGVEEPSMEQAVSSMTWKVWDDWCPWFYAKLMNKKTLAKGTDKEVLLIDFV